MSDCTQLKTWISIETKERFAAVARHQGLSESAMLKRLVDLVLKTAGAWRHQKSLRLVGQEGTPG